MTSITIAATDSDRVFVAHALIRSPRPATVSELMGTLRPKSLERFLAVGAALKLMLNSGEVCETRLTHADDSHSWGYSMSPLPAVVVTGVAEVFDANV